MSSDHSTPQRSRYTANLILAGMAGQVGCLTLVIILGAMLMGLWLDNLLHSRPLCTVGLVLGSVPLEVWLMYRLALSVATRIKSVGTPAKNTIHEQ